MADGKTEKKIKKVFRGAGKDTEWTAPEKVITR